MKKSKQFQQQATFVQGKTLELSKPGDMQTLNQKGCNNNIQSMRKVLNQQAYQQFMPKHKHVTSQQKQFQVPRNSISVSIKRNSRPVHQAAQNKSNFRVNTVELLGQKSKIVRQPDESVRQLFHNTNSKSIDQLRHPSFIEKKVPAGYNTQGTPINEEAIIDSQKKGTYNFINVAANTQDYMQIVEQRVKQRVQTSQASNQTAMLNQVTQNSGETPRKQQSITPLVKTEETKRQRSKEFRPQSKTTNKKFIIKPEVKAETVTQSSFERIYQQIKQVKDQVPLPPVSAEAWCVFDTDSEKLVTGKHANFKREVASLTKMMTFLVSWQLFQKHYPENTTIDIKVPKYCTQVTGTTAFLRKKDTLTLHQLFYALLLPSGNDAALVLADYFGGVIQSKNETLVVPKSYMFPENMPIRYFLREMNITASKIGMTNTTFDCPHGLSNNFNVSTALDVAILSYQCMQNDVFTTVVKTPFYEVETELAVYEWQNTNRLLGYDFDSEDTVPLFHGTLGCKTGITPSAGPCFAGYFSRYDNDQVEPDNCIVIVLNSKSMEARWVEVPALVKWYQKVKSIAIKTL